MTAPSATIPLRRLSAPEKGLQASIAIALLAILLGAGGALASQRFGMGTAAVPLAGSAFCLWLLAASRPDLALGVFVVYLTLLDGFLRLSTGQQAVTVIRDVLLYALAGGLLARHIVQRRSLRMPPFGAWVVLLAVLVGVQMAHPDNGTLVYSIAASRSHIEWLPLFFIAYVVMRDRRTLQAALLVLVLVTCINGLVGLAQFRLTPEELGSWGPGYAAAIAGTGSQSRRVYWDEKDDAKTRPFALGGDIGYGGYLGMLAIPALLALHATRSLPRPWMIVPLALGVTLALVTSQARSAIIGAVVSLAAYLFLTVRLRRLSRSALAFLVMAALAAGVVYMFASTAGDDEFIRYQTLAPGKLFDTLYDYRYYSFNLFPEYFSDYPLGAGLGSAGPAVALAVGGEPPVVGSLDAENEFNYLVTELGIPGLMLLFTFSIWLIFLTVFRIRKVRPPDVALMVAAIAAPLFALLASWIGFQVTAKTATAPYLWFAAGVLAYWLFPSRWERPVPQEAHEQRMDELKSWESRAALPAAR